MWNQVITLYTKNIQYLLVEEQLFTPELGSYRTFGIAALGGSPARRNAAAAEGFPRSTFRIS